MFYLLEDNRIIDSEELKRKLHFDAKVGIIDNELIVTLENFPIFRSESKIKKQSENVFDLIDWEEDLVKHKTNIFVWHCSVLNQTSDISEHIKNKTITAIYKPNEKGDYIKVWEKKDD